VNIKNPYLSVACLGFAHMVVDACCSILVLYFIDTGRDIFFYILLYNLIAFGLQLPLGWISDRLKKPKSVTLIGCFFVLGSLVSFHNPLISVCLAGFGNAVFHVGGGTIALNLNPRKTTMPGIFVAPGGIGLATGIILAQFNIGNLWFFIIPLLSAIAFCFFIKAPVINYKTVKTEKSNLVSLIILFFFLSISIRSVVGSAIIFPWKSHVLPAIILALAIACGKASGGIIADRLGWLKTATGGLLISALLLTFGPYIPAIAITGMFFFNFTMPITLVAISNLLPGKPGSSFGLASLALILGALPTFFHYKSVISMPVIILTLILVSVILIIFGLKLYLKNYSTQSDLTTLKLHSINRCLTDQQT
jgi:MFS transporter, FSR family, fosmidomycin resistance protein